jgi:raffinose/stachyose/melibiose transport system permease protein
MIAISDVEVAVPGRIVERPRRRRGRGKYYLLAAPALLLSALVVLIPGVLTGVAAFTNWNGISFHPSWVGFGNFRAIFADPIFRTALINNLKWAGLFVTIPVALGLGTGFLLLRRPRTRTVYQVVFLIPYVLAPVTNAILWLNIIYDPVSGLWGWLEGHGLVGQVPLGSTDTALYAVATVDMWHFWGFLMVVYLAALRQTPPEQIEAAQVEGASTSQLFRHVYLPNIMPTLLLMFVMETIFSFLSFDYIHLMTQGGPAHASEVLSTYAYTFAFSEYEFGMAAAVSLIMSFFGLLAGFFYVMLSRREVAT